MFFAEVRKVSLTLINCSNVPCCLSSPFSNRKILSHFLFVQVPFLISIPLASILFNLSISEVYNLMVTFVIGSLILSCLGSMSASMNLLNKANFSIGGIIVLLFSIPIIIFSVGINEAGSDFKSLINILIGIAFIFLGISPWASAAFIRLAIRNT